MCNTWKFYPNPAVYIKMEGSCFKKEANTEVPKNLFIVWPAETAKAGCKNTKYDWLSLRKVAWKSSYFCQFFILSLK